MEIAFPFTIYTDTETDMHLSNNKPLIHLNTLAQICFRAFSQASGLPKPEIVILDDKAVEGVSQSGRFEMDFDHNYFKKVGEISSELAKEKRFRLGLLYEKNAEEEQVIESYEKAVLLHGELTIVRESKQLDSKETAIQWITD
ncbi:hypothetical protein QL992_10700 [Microbacterium sp. APC 3898]|uniref:Uncharacterized protein n=2 Tax=Planococcus TaxID=1372 RepID=A0ABT7ZJS3_9BACL|nr:MULTISPECIES: hypothetical protein [Terrabacteria group]MBD8014525.1 hypothetical protein [Planococcus wigleyi]MDN3427404.1 hypothetical protein [Planococcus sp. APC 4016]MDN3436753.1 hypothetical protein [Planococcus sp. APC 3900]MDN3499688.1 hypothetical protein [Microbacterium sp. APC 3898]